MHSQRKRVSVASRAHRALKRIAAYRDLTTGGEWLTSSPPMPTMSNEETPIGLYINDPVASTDLVFFTTECIYVFRSGDWDQIRFAEIVRTSGPDQKVDVAGFDLLRKSESTFWLPIRGSHPKNGADGRYYDAFRVVRFVRNVVADIDRVPGRGSYATPGDTSP
jgi:hypothetical protein